MAASPDSVFGLVTTRSPRACSRFKRANWFSNDDVLQQATSKDGELLGLSSALDAHPGKLGVIEGGALADRLLFDGNPLDDLIVIVSFEETRGLMMKACKSMTTRSTRDHRKRGSK